MCSISDWLAATEPKPIRGNLGGWFNQSGVGTLTRA